MDFQQPTNGEGTLPEVHFHCHNCDCCGKHHNLTQYKAGHYVLGSNAPRDAHVVLAYWCDRCWDARPETVRDFPHWTGAVENKVRPGGKFNPAEADHSFEDPFLSALLHVFGDTGIFLIVDSGPDEDDDN